MYKIFSAIKASLQSQSAKWRGRIKYYASGLYQRIDTHHLFLFSSGLAFSLLLCIIPLVLIIFFILGNILDSESVRLQLNFLIDTSIPDAASAAFVKALVTSRVQEVIANKKIAGWLGGIGLLFAASGWFTGMRASLNLIFNVEKTPNTILGKLKDFGMVLFVVLLFVASLTLLPVVEIIKDLASRVAILSGFQLGFMQERLVQLASMAAFGLINFFLFYMIPDEKPSRRAVMLAAMWATILQEAGRQSFGYYLIEFSTWGKIYGAYAAMVIIAFWLYFSAMILLLSAEIGQLFRERNN